MKKILVAVDGSAPSLHAAKMALEIAQATGATLTAVYSVPPVALPGEVPFTIVNDVVKADTARGQTLLQEVLKELGTPTAQAMLLEGSPAEKIAETAETQDFDLVVVGSRGRNAVARLFLGSVADRLVHICKKPVLVVR
jgi:nucleotide-binding universal stress UspA family protein